MASDDRFRAYGRRVSSGGRPSTTSSRSTRTPSGGGGSPHGGGGGESQQDIINRNNQARIAKIKQDQQEQSIADRIIEERGGVDYSGDVYDPGWSKYSQKEGTTSAKDYYGDVQGAVDLGKALRNAGINEEQLERYKNAGILPENVAQELGLVKPGEHWDPRGKFTEEMYSGLSDLQFMQDEGVYGGVSGLEAEVNKIKEQAMTGNKEERDAAYKSLDMLFAREGKSPQETKKTVDAIINQFGYDPGGQFSFRDIEETAGRYGARDPKTGMLIQGDWEANLDPNSLYNKYLNRGTLWDDPLSGILKPQGQPYYGGGGGWGGWGGYGGGYGGGGGGSYGPQPGHTPEQMAGFYTPQANLQQAMVNVHGTPTVFKKRGGIVSLLRL